MLLLIMFQDKTEGGQNSLNACCFSIAVTRSKNVPMFGPPIPASALFSKNSAFTKFLLTKIINAENAAHRSDKFVSMATRTRQEYLKDLATNYATQTTIDSGSKFGKFFSQTGRLAAITKYKQNKIRQAQAGPGNISHLISVSFSPSIFYQILRHCSALCSEEEDDSAAQVFPRCEFTGSFELGRDGGGLQLKHSDRILHSHLQ